jgi:hypothetical protein
MDDFGIRFKIHPDMEDFILTIFIIFGLGTYLG